MYPKKCLHCCPLHCHTRKKRACSTALSVPYPVNVFKISLAKCHSFISIRVRRRFRRSDLFRAYRIPVLTFPHQCRLLKRGEERRAGKEKGREERRKERREGSCEKAFFLLSPAFWAVLADSLQSCHSSSFSILVT